MRALAIDPSTTSMGWAFTARTGEVRRGVIEAPKKAPRAARFLFMEEGLREILGWALPDFVIYYRPFARGADATRCGWGIAGVIEASACWSEAAVGDIAEATVRSWYDIKAPAGMKAGERRKWLKQKSLDIASELCQTDIKNDDIADAVLLLNYTTHNH